VEKVRQQKFHCVPDNGDLSRRDFCGWTLTTTSTTPNQDKVNLDSGVKKGSVCRLRCFDGVRTLKQRWNKWIAVKRWTDIVIERCDVPASLKFNVSNLNGAVSTNERCVSNETTKVVNVHGLCKASLKANKTEGR
jgi:hypothetical protein